MYVLVNGGAGHPAYIWRNLGQAYPALHARVYFRLISGGPATSSAGELFVMGFARIVGHPSPEVLIYRDDSAGTLNWGVWKRDAGTASRVESGFPIVPNVWTSVELEYTSSSFSLEIDGVQRLQQTGLSLGGAPSYFEVGDPNSVCDYEYDIDLATVSTSRIGP